LKKATGRGEYLKWLKGERLTYRQRILAHCYNCMNHYVDGRVDCKNDGCVFHTMMPYRRK